eukprot:CAMPEP_0206147750 /NCGR_PEP_ID=MMETSP1473-20131121/34475_1 /ASSEMBLY_ACC=CAM_ASM_001109 /TAXON_ID=1461547 /ORGANISM="Stichococcus sp, Strain RCC1054" /LENGTH=69 /DNA_ID=CAMNT_0053544825 /DNA_START=305 /DNA_END=510 /DNA_ORIENTATION=+
MACTKSAPHEALLSRDQPAVQSTWSMRSANGISTVVPRHWKVLAVHASAVERAAEPRANSSSLSRLADG